ncbi:VOC family protein [Arenibacter sp. M-2]|uniref:VOC family protein n=1 Tax=Arenibacter sp. M-2 TaxID=3053612 RepID=UPI002570D660|nr:VOC family protein [Arenibacter sp. M-2]MDL5512315.1 VOC family protein [Arenibacter sp. M-2]|tara:strand:+ start:43714 stop:44409 length:696 start_codon:yes stop_codon:yes gene_type:complete
MKIKELTLYTSHIGRQAEFYSQVLGLVVVKKSPKNISFQIGHTLLHFELKKTATPYHFAINIPANKEEEALLWLKSRLTILKDGQDDIINFTAWNARAIYFYDPDKNIVELIARKNLRNGSERNFGPELFLGISEIGIPTSNIENVFSILRDAMGIGIYDGGFGNFCAMGDEYGLFICIDKAHRRWFPTNDKAFPSEFELVLQEKGKQYHVEFNNECIKVVRLNNPNTQKK